MELELRLPLVSILRFCPLPFPLPGREQTYTTSNPKCCFLGVPQLLLDKYLIGMLTRSGMGGGGQSFEQKNLLQEVCLLVVLLVHA